MVLMAFLALAFGAFAGKNAASAATGLAANLREAIYANIRRFLFPILISSVCLDWLPV